MGALYKGGDMGFVHEGLHLLLGQEWAKDPKIIEIIKKANYNPEFYSSWESKFEQALVIGLDCCIRNFDVSWAFYSENSFLRLLIQFL